jgi:hypothetical protein
VGLWGGRKRFLLTSEYQLDEDESKAGCWELLFHLLSRLICVYFGAGKVEIKRDTLCSLSFRSLSFLRLTLSPLCHFSVAEKHTQSWSGLPWCRAKSWLCTNLWPSVSATLLTHPYPADPMSRIDWFWIIDFGDRYQKEGGLFRVRDGLGGDFKSK